MRTIKAIIAIKAIATATTIMMIVVLQILFSSLCVPGATVDHNKTKAAEI